jgi:hypothetical protein
VRQAVFNADAMPEGWSTTPRGLFSTDNVVLVVPPDTATVEEFDDLERRFRLLLKNYILKFQEIPPGLEPELEATMQTV